MLADLLLLLLLFSSAVPTMKYSLFLLDLDDTLFDFSASNAWSFKSMVSELGLAHKADALFQDFLIIDTALWQQFEQGLVSRDELKLERFRQVFAKNGLCKDAEQANQLYLAALATHVELVEGAKEVCQALSAVGEIGIITNGFEHIQRQRVHNSGLQEYISFIASSEACGYAKPDPRLFDFAVAQAKTFRKDTTVIVGDRLEADILGGNNFEISSCWFNPTQQARSAAIIPTYEVQQLNALLPLFCG